MDILPNAILASSMALFVYIIGLTLPFNDLTIIITQIVLGVIIYISVSHISKNESYLFVRDTLKEYIEKLRS